MPTFAPIDGTNTYNYKTTYDGSTDLGYNISEQGTVYAGGTVNELAHLFYNTLNNKGSCSPTASTASFCDSQAGFGLANTGPFTNLQAEAYWSYRANAPAFLSFSFNFRNGAQQEAYAGDPSIFAFAVSPGDVGTVPEIDTWAMLLIGLGLVGAVTRRR